MKKRTTVAVLLCLLLVFSFALCGCQANVEANRGRKINSVNHRGYGDAPENTLSAYRLSKEMGFTMVETDVSFTKDGQAVLLHDDTVNRTSNIDSKGKVKISDLTLDEVRALEGRKIYGRTNSHLPRVCRLVRRIGAISLHRD